MRDDDASSKTQQPAAETSALRLPRDIRALMLMRDQLDEYLATLEYNIDAGNKWIETHSDDIVLGYHQLVRALRNKNELSFTTALDGLAASGAAGFVLSLDDFVAKAAGAFGATAARAVTSMKTSAGIPADILEPLPEIRRPTQKEIDSMGEIELPPEPPAPQPEKKRGLFSRIFGAKTTVAAAQETREEMIARRENEMRQQWLQLRNELVGLQSNKHYFVRGSMEWLAELIDPQTPQPEGAPDADIGWMLEQYEEPEYIIRRAQEDYDRLLGEKTAALRERAAEYSRIATAFDEKNAKECLAIIDRIQSGKDPKIGADFSEKILKDLGFSSFANLALKYMTTREDQFALLKKTLKHEDDIRLVGGNTPQEKLRYFIEETLHATPPLPVEALQIFIDLLKKRHDVDELLLQSGAFDDIGAILRQQNTAQKIEQAMQVLSIALDSVVNLPQAHADVLTRALRDFLSNDTQKMRDALLNVHHNGLSGSFLPLWALCSGQSARFLSDLIRERPLPEARDLVHTAFMCGMIDDFKTRAGNATTVIDFIKSHYLASSAALTAGDLDRLSVLLSHTIDGEGRNAYGAALSQDLISRALQQAEELQTPLVNALLTPFADNAVRANLLACSAAYPFSEKLKDLEKALINPAARLTADHAVIAGNKLSLVFYDSASREIRAYAGGAMQHVLLGNVDKDTADAWTLALSRHYDMMPGKGCAFNPKNIDVITIHGNGLTLAGDGWSHVATVSRPSDLARIAGHADFVNSIDVENTTSSHINAKSVALLEKSANIDEWNLIDRFGFGTGGLPVTEPESLAPCMTKISDDAYVNFDNFSMIKIDKSSKTLYFRIESTLFDDLLESDVPGESFYNTGIAEPAALERLVESRGDYMKCSNGIRINLKKAGFLSFRPDAGATIEMLKHDSLDGKSLLETNDPDMFASMHNAAKKCPALLATGNLYVYPPALDDAYYDLKNKEMTFTFGAVSLKQEMSQDEALDILDKLRDKHHFHSSERCEASNLANAFMIAARTGQSQADIATANSVYWMAHGARNLDSLLESTLDGFKDAPALMARAQQRASIKEIPPVPATARKRLDMLISGGS